jgi:ubiquinone/menaquinone biosynthesis C-methylase UbiE/uncharacterized protein YbaR (Trm112 family)
MIDPWYLRNLVCPVDRSTLTFSGNHLVSQAGRRYAVEDGVPVMLVPEREPTLWVAEASIKRARGVIIDERAPQLYLETIVSSEERTGIAALAASGQARVDPVVAYLVAHTNGYSYQHLVGKLDTYPIPDPPLAPGHGKLLLDIGCSWGRWSIAAARKGYAVVGIDPSLGAVMAARRVARGMNLDIRHVVADARYLPFRTGCFDTVFSNGVIQHFSKRNAVSAFAEAARVLATGGVSLIQMANCFGIRSLQHLARRGFREGRDFEVRYWTVPALKRTFDQTFGNTQVFADCYFGLGLQATDRELMKAPLKRIVDLSEFIKSLSRRVGALTYVADSVYLQSRKTHA